MRKPKPLKFFTAASILLLACLLSHAANAEDTIETAGVAVGVSLGNIIFLPVKAISMTMGAVSGALSYVVTGGNADLTKQIWQDTSQGPYVITPSLARDSIGERPLLEQK